MDFKYFEEVGKYLLSIDIVDTLYIVFVKYGFSMFKAIIFLKSIFFVSYSFCYLYIDISHVFTF